MATETPSWADIFASIERLGPAGLDHLGKLLDVAEGLLDTAYDTGVDVGLMTASRPLPRLSIPTSVPDTSWQDIPRL